MNNKEAIKYLIPPFATSTKSYNEYLKQQEAYDLAIKALKEREALNLAIKALEQQLECGCNTCEYYPIKDQRPQGEWQPISEDNRHECNRCKEYAPSFKDGSEHLSKFCPNCGARMQK